MGISLQNPTWSVSMIAKAAEIGARTVRNILKRSFERKAGTGRKVGTGDVIREKKNISALK